MTPLTELRHDTALTVSAETAEGLDTSVPEEQVEVSQKPRTLFRRGTFTPTVSRAE